jgi:hypothetical protein
VQKKWEKSDRYQQRAAGDKIWLVIHADELSLSTRFFPDETDRQRAFEIIRGELREKPNCFEKVCWLENALLRGVASLHFV